MGDGKREGIISRKGAKSAKKRKREVDL